MMKEFKILNDREHILQKPQMYVGSVNYIKKEHYILENNRFIYKEIKYIPALLKIINEIIDNSIDVFLKNKLEGKIYININENSVIVEDNGTGIPVVKHELENEYLPVLAWGRARAGTNFSNKIETIGTHGLGSYLTNVFSKKFIGETSDGTNKIKITFLNNAQSYTIDSVRKHSKSYTKVEFYPDLEYFKLSKIDNVHINLIKQRIINLAISFPFITFYFNDEKISFRNTKSFLSYFNENFEFIETDNYFISVFSNDFDDFKYFTYVNGLYLTEGGSHITYISDEIVKEVRNLIQKKYSNIKPGEIKNRLMLVVFFKNFINSKFSSQTKECLTNSVEEIKTYLGNIDFESLAKRIYKNENIINPIIDTYKIKEELKKKKEIQSLNKSLDNVKISTLIDAKNSNRDNCELFILEGLSASTGFRKFRDANKQGCIMLKGKVLNVYDLEPSKILDNDEIKNLLSAIGLKINQKAFNLRYNKIIITTDADVDGYSITALLLNLFYKYWKELFEQGKIYYNMTPIIVAKNKKEKKFYYTLDEFRKDEQNLQNYEIYYKKGLAALEDDEYANIIRQPKLLQITIDNISDFMLNLCFSNENADKRKLWLKGEINE